MPGVHCSSLLICSSDPASLEGDTRRHSALGRAFPKQESSCFPWVRVSVQRWLRMQPGWLSGVALSPAICSYAEPSRTHASVLVSLAIHRCKAERPRQIFFSSPPLLPKSSSPISSRYTQGRALFRTFRVFSCQNGPLKTWAPPLRRRPGCCEWFGSEAAVGSPPPHAAPSLKPLHWQARCPCPGAAPGKRGRLTLRFGGKKGK